MSKPSRRPTRRSFLLGAAGVGLLSACADRFDLDIANVEKGVEGGIGGTGIDGGVGLVGVATALGGVHVNGLRIETPADASYEDALGRIDPAALAVGQSLTVEAAREGPALVARRVVVDHPVIGEVDAIADGGRRLRVLGVEVTAPTAQTRLAVGDRVAVSGLWRDDRVIASRIDPVEAGPSVLAGVATTADGRGLRRLGGLQVRLPDDVAAPPRPVYATLRGARGGDGVFRAEAARLERFVGAAGPLKALSIEGYLQPVASAPFFEIAGLGHSFDAAAILTPFAEGRALFTGPYTGDFEVAAVAALPEAADARRAALAAPPSGAQVRRRR